MQPSTATTASPVSVLFGPQCTDINEGVSKVRAALKDDALFDLVDEVLQDLPAVWSDLVDAWAPLDQLPGDRQISALLQHLHSSAPQTKLEASNVISTPLTVLSHILEIVKLKETIGEKSIVDTQGFCVGFLAAAAVAGSRCKDDLRRLTATMIRLAVAVGALVDLDELLQGSSRSIAVRWKDAAGLKAFQKVLSSYPNVYMACVLDVNSATITAPEDEADELVGDLTARHLSVKDIELRGRFHTKAHRAAVQHILEYFENDQRLWTPNARALVLPLRSNIDGEVITKGDLKTIALESILVRQCKWLPTVAGSFDTMRQIGEDGRFLTVGGSSIVPRSVGIQSAQNTMHHDRCHDAHDLPGSIAPTNQEADDTIAEQCTVNGHISEPKSVPIAIVGMACRYPQAASVEKLWEMLELGKCAVSELPNDRFKMNDFARKPNGPFFGNFLDNPDAFDNRFFGISAREAESMDPQQRLLLEVAYNAMESAGYCGLTNSTLPSDIGCYVGVGSDDYTDNVGSQDANAFSATGTLQAFNTGRISHYFGWSGPSLVVDTACSSAAVAVHLACKALQVGDCSIAVAGGVNVMTSPKVTQNLAAASFLSPTGASKAFDASADGYCRGEGAGLVVLRPLEDALRNGDTVLAVIAGSAVNQGSNCSPITVPVSQSQQSLYRRALAVGATSPEDVSYVEAHGTGTQVGDPIEFDSIRHVFGGSHRKDKLFVGSIKDNIGHTETSSGVAALLKTVLMIQNGRIPKQANFTRLNPKIPPFDHENIAIAQSSTSWCTADRVAMVTNYGAAGSNAALLVKDHKGPLSTQSRNNEVPEKIPIFISAKTPDSLRAYCQALRGYVITQDNPRVVSEIAYNLAVKQSRALEYTATFISDAGESRNFLDQLAALSSNDMPLQKKPASSLPVILCFGGQTGNTASISEHLFKSSALLRKHLMACDETCQKLGLPSLFPTIFDDSPKEDLVSLHCVLFSIQYASAKAWIDCGLKVDRIIGHSFGQLTGLSIADSLSLLHALKLISQRAHLIESSWGPERGGMLSIEGSAEDIQAAIELTDNAVDVACVNGPQDVVIAGGNAAIAKIEMLASGKSSGLRAKRLRSTHGFHSRLVDAIVPGLAQVAQSLDFHPAQIPVEPCSESEDWSSVDPTKIVQHSRRAVYFKAAVERAAQRVNGPAIWLEAGSSSPVIPMVRRIMQSSESSEGHVFQSINLEGPQAQRNIAQATSNLWSKGTKVQFWAFHRCQSASYRSMNLPPYQFAKTRHWTDFNPSAFTQTSPPQRVEKPLGLVSIIERSARGALFSVNVSDPLYRSCAKGHAVVGQHLCPASLYVEIILKAAREFISEPLSGSLPHIQDLTICAPLLLESEGEVCVSLSQTESQHKWFFSLFTRQGDSKPETHATGEIGLHKVQEPSQTVARFQSLNRLIDASRSQQIAMSPECSGLMGPPVYQTFDRVVNYADYYRGVKHVFARSHEATGLVSLGKAQSNIGTCDPILIDNFLQVAGIHSNCLSDTRENEVFVCSKVGEIFIGDSFLERDADLPRTGTVYTSYDRPSKKEFSCDIFAFDPESGKLMVAIMSATFTSVLMPTLSRALKRLNKDASTTEPSVQVNHVEVESHTETPVVAARELELPLKAVPQSGGFKSIQEMFNALLGIPMDELLPSSDLQDIGVDSLMRTEVLAEISKRFHITLSPAALMEISDIRGLTQKIFPDVSVTAVNTSVHAEVAIEATLEQQPGQTEKPVNGLPDLDGLADAAGEIFAKHKSSIEHIQQTKWIGFCDTVFPRQMALVTAYVVEAFSDLGVPLESFKKGQAIPELDVLSQHRQVKNQLYSILQYTKLVQRTERGFFRTDVSIPTTPSSELHDEMIKDYPHHASEHHLLHTTGSKLANCLTGVTDPLAILFQDQRARELITDVYTHAPMFSSATMHLTQYLRSLLRQHQGGREIKILEIGAGTGGTTGYLLQQLSDISGFRFQYTFTDLSSSLVALARKRFKTYDFMRYTTLNVDQDPPSAMLGQYDIVISSNCVHATPSIERSTRNIRKLLRPDGILCLIELTRNLFWFDLVFGLLEGWWKFDDGREHALASENAWDKALRKAGYNWVDWSSNPCKESEILRLIVASPACIASGPQQGLVTEETVTYAEKDGVTLQADVYYPSELDTTSRPRPIALMIHGGGHVMLSRKDIRPKQTRMLLDAGFLPISIDYRLCPEVSLLEGPMQDSRDALRWVHLKLPQIQLQRPDIQFDETKIVAVGWSTGGHLAMTLAWTALELGLRAPEAILSFYCPSDYEDPFWLQHNLPFGHPPPPDRAYNPWEGIKNSPITAYRPSAARAGWMDPSDARSRIALHMNWKGQTLPVLLNHERPTKNTQVIELEFPSNEDIQAASPLAQIRGGRYQTPTFIIHGTGDDLIPVAQAKRTHAALASTGIDTKIRVLDAEHLFDLRPEAKQTPEMIQAVKDGIAFLRKHALL